MDALKIILASLCANITAFLCPIRNEIFGLVLLFAVNFLFGLLAFRLFRDAAVFFVMVTSIYLIGHLKGEEIATVQCVSFLTYVAIYFYGTNILRNARMVTQEKSTLFKILDFLYYVLSLRIVKGCGSLGNYFELYEKERINRV